MRNWFITGGSRGLGLEFAKAALEKGDRVALTSRNPKSLDHLVEKYGDRVLPLRLDVCVGAEIDAAFDAAVAAFGHLDIVMNNAGYILLGAIEEMTDAQAREEMETLFFGPLHVTKRAVEHMRPRGAGTIIQVSSLAGTGGLPGNSMYAAGKWALEGMSEALKRETEGMGIKVLIVQPAAIQTDIGSSVVKADPMPEYDATVGEQRARWEGGETHGEGDPVRCAQILMDVLEMEEMPFRLIMGRFGNEISRFIWKERMDEAEKYHHLSCACDFPKEA